MNKFIMTLASILFFTAMPFNKLLAQTFTINTFEVPPYVEKNKGLAIDIIKELFSRANIKYQIKIMPQKRSIISAQTNLNTGVFPIQRSQERETKFKWVGPILITQTALFSLKDDPINIEVFKDAFDYDILVVRGSADEEYLKGFGIKAKVANNDFQNAKKLKVKRARLWAADTITASYYTKKINVEIKKQLTLITTLRALGFHINTPDEVILSLNEGLNQMYKDGSIKKILEKHAKEFDIKDTLKFLE